MKKFLKSVFIAVVILSAIALLAMFLLTEGAQVLPAIYSLIP